MDGNPLCITFLQKRVTVCLGCNKKYSAHHRVAPLDLVFVFMCRRMRPDGAGKWFRSKRESRAYFHCRDLACVKEEKENASVRDIYMTNKDINCLTDDHVERLIGLGYWDYIQANRAAVGASE